MSSISIVRGNRKIMKTRRTQNSFVRVVKKFLLSAFVVLSFGRKIAEGDPDEIRNDPEVVTAYLGSGECIA